MLARTVKDLGALVRERRKELGWNQSYLAEQIGVQRLWVIQFEAGKPTAQIGLALRALRVLDLELQIATPSTEARPTEKIQIVDLDRVVTDNLNRVIK